MYAKVVHQIETTGKYGPGIHNHITDGCGNVLVLTTWRTHMNDLKRGKYLRCFTDLYNTHLHRYMLVELN